MRPQTSGPRTNRTGMPAGGTSSTPIQGKFFHGKSASLSWRATISRRLFLLVSLFLACLPLSAWGAPGGRDSFPLRISFQGRPRSLHDLGILYGHRLGIFGKYGLSPVLQPISGPSNLIASILNGDTHVALVRGIAVAAIAEGAELAAVGITTSNFPFSFFAGPGIGSSADLRGKKIVLASDSGLGGINAFFLGKMGLQGDGTVSVLSIPNTMDRLAALESGAVAGVLLTPPAAMIAAERGFRMLFDFTETGGPPENAVVFAVTSRAFLRDHPGETANFLRSLSEATYRMKRDREGAMETMAGHFAMDAAKDGKILSAVFDSFVLKHLSVVPRMDPDTVRSVIGAVSAGNPAAASLAVEQVCDYGAFRALESEGFFLTFQD